MWFTTFLNFNRKKLGLGAFIKRLPANAIYTWELSLNITWFSIGFKCIKRKEIYHGDKYK